MIRLIVITLLGLAAPAITLSDVNKFCIWENPEELSNDFLEGSWYEMYRFTLFSSIPPSHQCTRVDFRKPTAEELAAYKAKYNDPKMPYSLDDNPIIRNVTHLEGMVTGHTRAKFFVLGPQEANVLADGYSMASYRPLGDGRYIMYSECALRGHIRTLIARERYASVAEMEELIQATRELRELVPQRHCATY